MRGGLGVHFLFLERRVGRVFVLLAFVACAAPENPRSTSTIATGSSAFSSGSAAALAVPVAGPGEEAVITGPSQPQFLSATQKVTEVEAAWILHRTYSVGVANAAADESTYLAELASLCALEQAGFAPNSCSDARAEFALPADSQVARSRLVQTERVLRADELSIAVAAHLDLSLLAALRSAELAAARLSNERARFDAQKTLAEAQRRGESAATSAHDAVRAAEAESAKQARNFAEALRQSRIAQAKLAAAIAARAAEVAAYLR